MELLGGCDSLPRWISFPGQIRLESSKLTYIETAADEGKITKFT